MLKSVSDSELGFDAGFGEEFEAVFSSSRYRSAGVTWLRFFSSFPPWVRRQLCCVELLSVLLLQLVPRQALNGLGPWLLRLVDCSGGCVRKYL